MLYNSCSLVICHSTVALAIIGKLCLVKFKIYKTELIYNEIACDKSFIMLLAFVLSLATAWLE